MLILLTLINKYNLTFEDFNFNEELYEGLLSMGYKEPTPIQQMAIPVVQKGNDLIACAQTGTGKTASYLLPVLDLISKTDKKHTSTLILAPTRELAQQIDQQVEGLVGPLVGDDVLRLGAELGTGLHAGVSLKTYG